MCAVIHLQQDVPENVLHVLKKLIDTLEIMALTIAHIQVFSYKHWPRTLRILLANYRSSINRRLWPML